MEETFDYTKTLEIQSEKEYWVLRSALYSALMEVWKDYLKYSDELDDEWKALGYDCTEEELEESEIDSLDHIIYDLEQKWGTLFDVYVRLTGCDADEQYKGIRAYAAKQYEREKEKKRVILL